MGIWGITELENTGVTNEDKIEGYSRDLLHSQQCHVCPLGNADLYHPKLKTHGDKEPLVYMLGGVPGEQEDERGRIFASAAGDMLRWRTPRDWWDYLRFGKVLRCRTPKDRKPTSIEVECCRPFLERDIARSEPVAIFGFGNTVLNWLIGESDIHKWRGRRVPVNVGGHLCWFFPMYDPAFVLEQQRYEPRSRDHYGSEFDFALSFDLRSAFSQIDEGLPDPVIHSADFASKNVDIISDPNDAVNAIRRMWDSKRAGFDYETGSLRPFVENPKILSFALSSKDYTFSIPMEHPQNHWTDKQLESVFDELSNFLHNAKTRKIVHNLAFEQEWSGFFFGPDCLRSSRWDCSQAQAYLLYGKRGSDYDMGALSLNFLCKHHFGFDVKALSKVNRKDLISEPLERILPYNGIDARYHRRLFDAQEREIREAGMVATYEQHIRRIPTMVLTQLRGIPVDQNKTLELKNEFETILRRTEKRLSRLPAVKKFKREKGYAYRPAAPQDVTYMYRKILKAPIERTDEATITECMGNDPVTIYTLRWRKTNKKLSTYVLPMVEGAEDSAVFSDHLLHPVILLVSTDTWRTSCQKPNQQNWPKHQAGALEIRKQIKAPKKYKIVSFDYSGIQARNVAMESLDKRLVDAFWNDYDIHADWREKIAKVYPRWVVEGIKMLGDHDLAKKYRQKAKNGFVFATFFGAQAATLARHLEIPKEVTERLREDFMREFHGIDNWHKNLSLDYYRDGYVTGKSGHRRYAPISPNQLINAPIQADESTIVCDAMARLSELEDDRFQAMLEVHDDLTFCWPATEVEKNSEVVIEHMLNTPFEWARVVPLGVERSIGDNWGELHEDGEKYSSKTWKGGLWTRKQTR